jgi:hypothetical protein
MADRLTETVLRQGLREYYDPYTGEGLGAMEFAWTSLICELVEPDFGAAELSYLPASKARAA